MRNSEKDAQRRLDRGREKEGYRRESWGFSKPEESRQHFPHPIGQNLAGEGSVRGNVLGVEGQFGWAATAEGFVFLFVQDP